MRSSVTWRRVSGATRQCGVLAALIVVGVMAPSRSHAQTTERISDLNAPNRFSDFPAISADGRYVAFVSAVTGIGASQSTDMGYLDVFVSDRLATPPVTIQVSEFQSSPNIYQQPNGHSSYPSISANGRWIAFQSRASNMELALVTPDPNVSNTWSIFIRDRDGFQITIASFHPVVGSNPRSEANGESRFPALSGNGRHVAFSSSASNLLAQTKGAKDWDIYVFDRDPANDGIFDDGSADQIGAFVLISQSFDNDQATPPSGSQLQKSFPSISGDGRYVAFATNATNLVDEDEDGQSDDTNNTWDVFVRDRDPDGDGVFDELNNFNIPTSRTIRISHTWTGGEAIGASRLPAISADGRYVAFVSWDDQIVVGDTNGQPDVFVYDLHANTMVRISVTSYGVEANGASGCPACRPVISSNGRFVAFSSLASNFVTDGFMGPADTNNAWDIFVHDRDADGNGVFDEPSPPPPVPNQLEVFANLTIETFRASVSAISSESNRASFAPSFGYNPTAALLLVLYHSWSDNLTPNDVNETKDVFLSSFSINNP